MILKVIKRNGKIVIFNKEKIVNAINNAMRETIQGVDITLSETIADKIEEILTYKATDPTVEEIQDLVEEELMNSNRKDVAKRYIIYRYERSKVRGTKKESPSLLTEDFLSKYKHTEPPMTQLGMFTYYRTYSRWLPEEGRREQWWETVRRAVEYNCNLTTTSQEEAEELYDNVFHLRQFLSGRTFWVGGTKVSEFYPMSNFNCSFLILNTIPSFRDLFYLLMLGTGVGFRVLKEDVRLLPKARTNIEVIQQDYSPVPKEERVDHTSTYFIDNSTVEIIIGDSKEGWSDSLYFFLNILTDKMYKSVNKIIINYDHVRSAGEKLNTFGGKASGHESIKNMFYKIDRVIKSMDNRSNKNKYAAFQPINIIDIANIIGENVVIGGVRRTSQMAIISPDDVESIQAKSTLYEKKGSEWVQNKALSHRRMSNNTIFYEQKPSRDHLKWHLQQIRYSGEPGFVNVEAARKRFPEFEGMNPCGEVLLTNLALCNLVTENVCAFIENGVLNIEKLLRAQELNIRASYRMSLVELELHHWNLVQKKYKVIGCSLTGWQDMVARTGISKEEEKKIRQQLKEVSQKAAKQIALECGDEVPILMTTIKPEGTLSLVAAVSHGLHHAHARFYIRRIRITASDPLCKVCEELGYPMYPEDGETEENCTTKVIEFPVKSEALRTKYDVSAIEQLETYKAFMEEYVDHNASITVHVQEHEWDDVEKWVWENWDSVVAITFMSLSDSFYPLMPYEQITEEEYNERVAAMKPFIPSLLSKYETEEVDLDVGDLNDCDSGSCAIR